MLYFFYLVLSHCDDVDLVLAGYFFLSMNGMARKYFVARLIFKLKKIKFNFIGLDHSKLWIKILSFAKY
jgi:hypothetical protein